MLAGIRAELEDQLASIGAPSEVRSFAVADVDLHLRVYGDELAEALLPAFDGRSPGVDGATAITVHIWDHSATDTRPPTALRSLAQPGRQPRYVDRTHHLVLGEGVCSLVGYGGAHPTAIVTVAGASSMPWFHRGSPAAHVLADLLARRARPFVHAACVGLTGKGAVLIAGRGGSGKSTTALRCLAAGWQYIGDDYIVVRADDATAHCVYSTAKLAPMGFSRDQGLELLDAPLSADPLRIDKTIAQLWPTWMHQMPSSLPIKAIVAPVVSGARNTTWRRDASGRGLLALAPSTLLQLPTAAAAQLAPLSQLARSVPSVTMELGSDPDGVVGALADVLDLVGACT